MEKNKQLRVFAEEIRVETLRELAHLGFGHVGGAMSIVELLAILYGKEMRVDPKNPKWEDRDRLIVSKGHAGPVIYATLALMGFFPKEVLLTLNQGGTILPSHCDGTKTPGVDMTTGSLGQGISTACGVALGNKTQKKDAYTYLILGDGECNEGQVWEAAMFAAAHGLDNMTWLLDNNKKQLDGTVEEILDTGDLAEKFAAFGFNSVRIDGHDVEAIYDTIHDYDRACGKPQMIVLDTVKGKGVADIEAMPSNHSITVPYDDATRWMAELAEEVKALREEA